mmetsp:Transcript_26891/g.57896  ORF Transcript_26891/g.57896 Transcript_26891/m.57896 type:complete len:1160 (-) Transcript_26891:251-3730(-)
MTYTDIIHEGSPEGGAPSLKSRLVRFRKWATKKAGITVHGAVCIVNGEATDGQRNAPVLLFEPRPDPRAGGNNNSSGGSNPSSEVRCGAIDDPADRAMYDRSIGCQVRTVRELKKDEVALSIPSSAMITPDLIAASDAGQALFACCRQPSSDDANFWDMFGATSKLEKNQAGKIQQSNGTQLLVKILQQRKQLETMLMKAERIAVEVLERGGNTDEPRSKLTSPGAISRRAPFLAFLIHQRFADEQNPSVASEEEGPMVPEGAPETFAPYARALPSSICLPICWKRNELALLAGCIPGMPALQKVAARTMQLSMELIALVDAGLLWRFPSIFQPGMITWDRWVWAAAVYESRVLPASSLPAWIWSDTESPPDVWESCGVIIPFLDMLNHEDDSAQVQWKTADEEDASMKRLNIVTDEKTKKHMQIYRNYGTLDNEHFMLQFGFTRMTNPADRVRIAWALVDGVGGVAPPADYEPVSDTANIPLSHLVFESTDADSLKAWWTEQRIALLGKATLNNDDTLDSLRKGKKITFCAFNSGNIDPMLIAVAIVATIPHEKVVEMCQKSANTSSSKPLDGLTLDKTCQHTVRLYLSFLFAKKLGKLLQSLNSCLRDHFNSVQLWTRASSGGLNYVANNEENEMSIDGSAENSSTVMGWQSFFDTYAWYSTMEVEDRYYSMAPDSCVLTLYDGHVRSLQNSLDIMATDAVFNEKVKQQLEDIGCTLDNTAITPMVKAVQPVVTPVPVSAPEKEKEELVTIKSAAETKPPKPSPPKKEEQGNGQENGNKQRDRPDRHSNKTRTKGERPPAIKLHIGNLSYKTLPNQLYDFFTRLYGKDSVLECHIPTERDTGNSRGFGFVTMPDEHAKAALESGRKHEMDGRILKVAESNSAGSNKGRQQQGRNIPPQAPSGDRCTRCGYRPRWCTCNPNMMPLNMGMGPPPPHDNIYGPGPYLPPPPPPMGGPGFGHHLHDMDDRRMGDGHGWGGGGGGGWGNKRSFSRSPSYRRERDRGYRRSRSYSRSRSRSYSRGRDRSDRHRGRHDDDRRRYEDDRGRGSSRRYRSKSRSRSRQRDSATSPNRRLNDESGNFSDQPKGGRSLSRSRSPADNNGIDRPSSKKREGKDSSGRGGRSRSRDRGSRRRKRSKGSRRDKGSSSKRRGGSRSRSRDRH